MMMEAAFVLRLLIFKSFWTIGRHGLGGPHVRHGHTLGVRVPMPGSNSHALEIQTVAGLRDLNNIEVPREIFDRESLNVLPKRGKYSRLTDVMEHTCQLH